MDNQKIPKRKTLYGRMVRPLEQNLAVEQGGFWRRVGAFLIDFICAALIAVLAYNAFVHPIWYNNLGGVNLTNAISEEQLASGLYVEIGVSNAENDETSSAVYRLTDLLRPDLDEESNGNVLWFELSNEQIVPSDTYYDFVLRYFYDDYPGFQFSESTYYDANSKTTKDYQRDILLMSGEEDDFIKGKQEIIGEYEGEVLYSFTYSEGTTNDAIDEFWRTQYFTAVDDNFTNMDAYASLQNKITQATRLMVAISYLIGGLIFHLLIPLLSKDGQTLGKIVTKLAVVNKEGHRVKPSQIVIRALFMIIVEIIGSIYLLLVPLLLTMAFVTLSRQQRSMHDFVAGTRIINFDNSYIFASREEQEAYEYAKTNKTPTNIYPGGGLGQKETARRLEAAQKRYK